MRDFAQQVDEMLRAQYHAPDVAAFTDGDGGKVDFLPADDLAQLAKGLIAQYPELGHLRDDGSYPIVFLWRREGGATGGKATLGKCTKASGLVKHFSEAAWVIWLAADHVNDSLFTARQVEALLYHELAHTCVEESGKPGIVAHDFTGFLDEIKRYGDWMADLGACKRAWQQAALPET